MSNKKNHIMDIVWLVSVALLLCMLFTGCAGTNVSNSKAGDKLKVVTTLYVSYDYVRAIAGDNVDVTMLLKPGEESHSYDPTPQDVIAINDCDLFIYNGGENDEWVDRVLESASGVNSLKMMDLVTKLYEEETVPGMQVDGHGHEHGHEHSHEHGHEEDSEEDYDEHVWASPVNALAIVQGITESLTELDSDNATIYEDNCAEYTAKLRRIDEEFRQIVASSKRTKIVFGDRFPIMYFTKEYGLDYSAAFPGCSAQMEPSVATMTYLIDDVRKDNIPVVFKTELSNDNVARVIAEETGAKVRTFYSCHNVSKRDFDRGYTYLEMMQENIEVLKEALN